MAANKNAGSDLSHKLIARMAREVVCEAFSIPHADLHARDRGASYAAQARQMAMYLTHVVGQLTLSETAKLFKRDRSTVSHACINVEDRRDSPIFDLQIEYMERRLRDRCAKAVSSGIFPPNTARKGETRPSFLL